MCPAFLSLDARHKEKSAEELTGDQEITEEISVKKLIIGGLFSRIPIFYVLGVVAALIPGIKWLFVYDDSPLLAIYDSLFTLGYCGVILSQLIVGSNIYLFKPTDKHISIQFLVISSIMKNVFYTAIWLYLTVLLWNLGVFGGNRVIAYVVFIAQSSPVATLVVLLCQVLKTGIKEITVILIWHYLSAPLFLMLYSYAFFIYI
ncbi:unnamed protein product [Blepharisma stoltei]|uniref:Uncharacterized protein n=1 Tax=Blepharisma stoltei TaxID=1481888 RepID=A0AAU9KEX1_9CILI|nr:unnamed protein product [Blepharisma stoltei]